MKPFNAWIALSEKGYPGLFIGYFMTKKALESKYRITYGGSLKSAGYVAVKVRIQEP